MRVVIGGGTGFVGRHLCRLLREHGYRTTIISRKEGPDQMTWNSLSELGLPEDCTAVVNIAGENILNPMVRWSEEFKNAVISSRVDTTKMMAEMIKKARNPPKVFVTMSGVGYYEPSPTAEYTESSTGGDFDFLSRLCTDWESAGSLPDDMAVRRVIVRSGVVLGRDGGMIQQLFLPFFLGIGGKIGTGKQWFPWIHIADISGIICHAIKNDDVTGILNGVAPEMATNSDFTQAYGRAMWRPTVFPIPTFMIKFMYQSERSKIILEGQKVIPKRTLESGYKYVFPDLKSTCSDCAKLMSS
ncbi:hypothetical protein ScPMuIL_000809 [Solemya velum]